MSDPRHTTYRVYSSSHGWQDLPWDGEYQPESRHPQVLLGSEGAIDTHHQAVALSTPWANLQKACRALVDAREAYKAEWAKPTTNEFLWGLADLPPGTQTRNPRVLARHLATEAQAIREIDAALTQIEGGEYGP